MTLPESTPTARMARTIHYALSAQLDGGVVKKSLCAFFLMTISVKTNFKPSWLA